MIDKIKILLADDHPLLRRGLKWVLDGVSNFDVLHQAENGQEALDKVRQNDIDIAILDVEMPELSGLEVTRTANLENNSAKIIILTMYKDEDMFNEAMNAGAMGYVLKENASEDIVNCVNTVAKGNYYISPLISHYLVKRNREIKELNQQPSISHLTKTERKVLRLISESRTTNEIADLLFSSSKTIENHRSNISKKLNLKGSHSLVKFAIENKSFL